MDRGYPLRRVIFERTRDFLGLECTGSPRVGSWCLFYMELDLDLDF